MEQKLGDRLFPMLFDGQYRRRMIAGVIATVGLALGTSATPLIGLIGWSTLKDTLDTIPELLIVITIALVIYAFGTLIDIFSQSTMNRILGNLAGFYFLDSKKKRPRFWKALRPRLKALTCLRRNSRQRFSWNMITEQGIVDPIDVELLSNAFPREVSDGIRDPFGATKDVPWAYFMRDGEEQSVRSLTQRLAGLNKDVLVISTSLVIFLISVTLPTLSVYLLTAATLLVSQSVSALSAFGIPEVPPSWLVSGFIMIGIVLLYTPRFSMFLALRYFMSLRDSFLSILKLKGALSVGYYSGISIRPDVCGGEPCIIGTRIPVWLLERARQSGMSDKEILDEYGTLNADDLANAWAYVSANASDIDRQIVGNEEI